MKTLWLFLSTIRLIPHIFMFNFHKEKQTMQYDTNRWLEITNRNTNLQIGFITLMTSLPEFRNLFYARMGASSRLISWLCPKMNTLYIITRNIGPGLFIQHGFATIIAAKSIGKDCWINQQVTIGFANKEASPIIGDNVTIYAGAKIIGGVKVGNNSIAGANAVVVKNVPENCVVAGVPAYIIRRNGIRVEERL